MNTNLEYFKTFYYVARCGSISAAAQQLFISQPAVSQIIKHLENDLGSSLFFRTTKGVRLTPEGEVLFSYVAKGYDCFVQAEAVFQQMLDLESGEIRIGASDMTLQFYLLPYLEEFHRRYPKIKIKVSNAPTPETIGLLKEGGIDFGVVTAPLDPDPDFTVREVAQIQDCFVAGEEFSQLRGRDVSLKELSSYPVVMLEKRTSNRRFVDSCMEKAGISLDPEFELATSELIVQFALRCMGIGCVVRNFAQGQLEENTLFELSIQPPFPPRKMCLITPAKAPISPAGKRLLQFLEIPL